MSAVPPIGDPPARPADEPAAEPAAEPADEPTVQRTARPTGESTDVPAAVPTDVPAAVPTDDPTDRPTPGADLGGATAVRRAFLGLGSNLGDRVRYLRDAVDTLRAVGLVGVSPVYETAPVGGPEQGPYLNLVVELHTDRSAHELLGVCRRLEAAAGRIRDERWGPRTLDVDVLWVEGTTIDDADLVVPHPRLWERRFVVAPLHDLAPDVADDRALAGSEGQVERRGALEDL